MNKVLSYHNNPKLKEDAVASAQRHQDLDMLLAGTYGHPENGLAFKGCSVGCDAFDISGSTDTPHKTTADYYGFPEWLERLRDTLFEGLDQESRKTFHVEFKKAIPVGVDLEPVRHHLAIARLNRLLELHKDCNEYGLKGALILVLRCHEAEINSQICDWSAALSAAESARSVARSVEGTVESAALSVVWSARAAVRSAAEAASWSVESAAEAVRSSAFKIEAETLLKLLSECK